RWDGTRTPPDFPLRVWTSGHFPASGATFRTQDGSRAGGDASTSKRVVEVNPTATPGAGSTSGREGEPDGRRHQVGGPRPTHRRWNSSRARKGPAGRAPDASGTGGLVDSASRSKLITPRLLSLRAAANYL